MPNKKIIIAAAAILLVVLAVLFKPVRIVLLVLFLLVIIALAVDVVVYIDASKNGLDIRAKYFGFQVYPRKKKGSDAPADDEDEQSFVDDIDDELVENSQEVVQNDESAKPPQTEKPPETELETVQENVQEDDDDEAWDGEPEDDDEPQTPGKPRKKRENPLVKKVKSLRAKYEKYKPFIPMAWKGFRQLCKTIRFYIDDAWVDVGRFDAHEAAIYYGSIQALIAETFKDIAVVFTLKPRCVKRCDVNVKWGKNVIDGAVSMRIKLRLLTIIGIILLMGIKFIIIKLRQRRQKKAQADTSAEPT